jgi:hypothetical protein
MVIKLPMIQLMMMTNDKANYPTPPNKKSLKIILFHFHTILGIHMFINNYLSFFVLTLVLKFLSSKYFHFLSFFKNKKDNFNYHTSK